MKIKLSTSEELCKKANKIDYRLRHEEDPRVSFIFKWTNSVKSFLFKFRF